MLYGYDETKCEDIENFSKCLNNQVEDNSMDPTTWASCEELKDDKDAYHECLYDGFKALHNCFLYFCTNDPETTEQFRKNRDLYDDFVEDYYTNEDGEKIEDRYGAQYMCEKPDQFNKCINVYEGLYPEEWAECKEIQDNENDFNNCVYNGYNNLIECFDSFCIYDASRMVDGLKNRQSNFVSNSTEIATPTDTIDEPQETTVPIPENPTNEESEKEDNPPPANGGETTTTTTTQKSAQTPDPNKSSITESGKDKDNGAFSNNKVSKLVVGILMASSLLMRFI